LNSNDQRSNHGFDGKPKYPEVMKPEKSEYHRPDSMDERRPVIQKGKLSGAFFKEKNEGHEWSPYGYL